MNNHYNKESTQWWNLNSNKGNFLDYNSGLQLAVPVTLKQNVSKVYLTAHLRV